MPTKTKAAVTDLYLDLVKRFPLRTVRTPAEHEAALAFVRLLLLKPEGYKRPAGEADYLGALTTLIDAYERKAYPARDTAVHERLRHVVEESGTSQADLGRLLGLKQPAVSLILAGKRGLNGEAVKRLAGHFKLNAAYFL